MTLVIILTHEVWAMKNEKLAYDLSILSQFNWHIHTNLSACAVVNMTVGNIITCAEDSNLEGIAFVDHHYPGKGERAILDELGELKEKFDACETKVKVVVGAELSAFGIGKYADSIETNKMIDYRLYACNHYHVYFWEHPATTFPRAYAEHHLATLTDLLKSGRADCIAHPFVGACSKDDPNVDICMAKYFSDKELADILELGRNNGVAWELNLHDAFLGDPQFVRRYWNIGREVGISFHFGTDAHRLLDIDTKQFVPKLRSILTSTQKARKLGEDV